MKSEGSETSEFISKLSPRHSFAQKQHNLLLLYIFLNLQTIWKNRRHLILSLYSFSALNKLGMPQGIRIIRNSNNSLWGERCYLFYLNICEKKAQITSIYALW